MRKKTAVALAGIAVLMITLTGVVMAAVNWDLPEGVPADSKYPELPACDKYVTHDSDGNIIKCAYYKNALDETTLDLAELHDKQAALVAEHEKAQEVIETLAFKNDLLEVTVAEKDKEIADTAADRDAAQAEADGYFETLKDAVDGCSVHHEVNPERYAEIFTTGSDDGNPIKCVLLTDLLYQNKTTRAISLSSAVKYPKVTARKWVRTHSILWTLSHKIFHTNAIYDITSGTWDIESYFYKHPDRRNRGEWILTECGLNDAEDEVTCVHVDGDFYDFDGLIPPDETERMHESAIHMMNRLLWDLQQVWDEKLIWHPELHEHEFVVFLPPSVPADAEAQERLDTGNALIEEAGLRYRTVEYGETDPDAGPPEDGVRLPRWYRIDGKSHDGRTWGGLRWLQAMLDE